MLEQNDVVTLSNSEKYLIIYKTIINEIEYAFLINMENDEDTMVCKIVENRELKVVTDVQIINLFLKKFAEEI